MLRSLFVSFAFILIAYMFRLYIDSSKKVGAEDGMVNILEGVTIKSYSKDGIEWTVKGKKLEVVKSDIRLIGVELSSKDGNIKAGEAYLDRLTGIGELKGGVELVSGNLIAKTAVAYMNLKEGEIWGEERLQIVEGKNSLEGSGFRVRLKPLQVIIKKGKVRIE